MNRYQDNEFKKSMRIRYDFNNLMDSGIDAKLQDKAFQDKVGAISKKDIDDMMDKYSAARASLDRNNFV